MVEFRMRVAHVTQYLIRWTVPIFLPFRKEKSPFRISASVTKMVNQETRSSATLLNSCSFLVFVLFFFFFFFLFEGIGRRLFETNILLESFNFPRSLELFDRKVRGNILK